MFFVLNGLVFEIVVLIEFMVVGWYVVWCGEVGKGDVVIVIGCGLIGFVVICMLKLCGVYMVIVSDFLFGCCVFVIVCGVDFVVDFV